MEVQIGQPRSAAWTPRHHPLRSGWSRDPHSSPPSRSLPPPPIVVLAGDGLTISSDPADSVVRVPAMLSPLVAVAHIVQGTSARSVRRGWRWRARSGGYQLPSDASTSLVRGGSDAGHHPGPGDVSLMPPLPWSHSVSEGGLSVATACMPSRMRTPCERKGNGGPASA